MMKRTLIILVVILSCLSMSAQKVSESAALGLAQEFMNNEQLKNEQLTTAKANARANEGRVTSSLDDYAECSRGSTQSAKVSPNGGDLEGASNSKLSTLNSQPSREGASKVKLSLIKKGLMPESKAPAYYLFADKEESNGFVIVAGDERASHQILGYSSTGSLDADNIPENLQTWLDSYAEQIEWLTKQNQLTINNEQLKANARSKVSPNGGDLEGASNAIVSPLISTTWGQGEPYNAQTPKMSGTRTLVGCVAVAVAQIMNYHKWPEQGTGSVEYEWNNAYLERDFSESTYNWNNIDVAQLLSDVGYGCQMKYGLDGSSSTDGNAGNALVTYFKYDKSMQLHYRTDLGTWNADAWDNMIRDELDAKRPVYYSGVMKKGRATTGHAFVCDGYDDAGYFHFNFGWEGTGDGWYVTSAINPEYANYGFNLNQAILTNIKKDAGGALWLGAATQEEGLCDGKFWALQDTIMEGATFFEDATTGEKTFTKAMPFHLEPNKFTSIGYIFPEGEGTYYIDDVEYPAVTLADGTYKMYRQFRIKGSDTWQSYDYNYGQQFGENARESFIWLDVKDQQWTRSSSLTFNDDTLKYRIINDTEAEVNGINKGSGTITIPSTASYRGKDYKIAGVSYISNSSITKLILPEGLRYIGKIFFGGTELILPSTLESIVRISGNFASITIPASVTKLGSEERYETYLDGAFNSNGALKTVTFADGINLKKLPEYCFYGCTKLKNINLPESLERIESSCFKNCGSMKTLSIPANVRYIGEGAFSGCTMLEHIDFAEDAKLETIEGGTSSYDDCFYGCEYLENISFPASLKEFNCGFTNCGIAFADFSRTQIATIATDDLATFYNCHGLEAVLLPPTLKKIGNMFYNCEKMLSFTIPDGVDSIGSLGAANLPSLVLPASLKYLASISCASNATIVCEGTTPPKGGGLTNKSGITVIVPAGALQAYKDYRYVYGRYGNYYTITGTIVEKSTESTANIVAQSGGATVMGTSSTDGNVTIPSSVDNGGSQVPVTGISDYAFMGNGQVKSVDIPSTIGTSSTRALTSGIGTCAFAYCLNMDTVIVHWTTPLTIDATIFKGIDLSTRTLIVPEGTSQQYKAADYWKNFGNIQEPSTVLLGDANEDKNVDVTDITAIASHILGKTPDPWNAKNADANSDGSIDVTDITATAAIILGK